MGESLTIAEADSLGIAQVALVEGIEEVCNGPRSAPVSRVIPMEGMYDLPTHNGQHWHQAHVKLAAQPALSSSVDDTRRLLLTDILGRVDIVVDKGIVLAVLGVLGVFGVHDGKTISFGASVNSVVPLYRGIGRQMGLSGGLSGDVVSVRGQCPFIGS